MNHYSILKEITERSLKTFSISTARYLILAGLAYLLFYVILKEKWRHKKIQQRFPDKTRLWFEFKYSMLNMFIFVITGLFVFYLGSIGVTRFYKHISDYGWTYFLFSIVVMIFLHDTYFYWVHRLMHAKKIYPYIHKVHHQSINPTPWAAFSFHPIEGFLEAAIVPIIVVIIPVHTFALVIFILISTILNVLGHLGFELYPKGFTKSKWTGWNNTSTHHNMHHHYFDCNYGLYFNFWDKLMETNHKDYHETFEKMAEMKK
jgi:sterol desaturase/sphingolipid hydroxylase (fatty acid hydroxylase superfamily)